MNVPNECINIYMYTNASPVKMSSMHHSAGINYHGWSGNSGPRKYEAIMEYTYAYYLVCLAVIKCCVEVHSNPN